MTTPVTTTKPRIQKQQNYNGERKMANVTRHKTTSQPNRNPQPFSNQLFPPENIQEFRYNSASQQATQRVNKLPSMNRSGSTSGYRNEDSSKLCSHNAYPSSSQQPVTQRAYRPSIYQPASTLRSLNNISASAAQPSVYMPSNLSSLTNKSNSGTQPSLYVPPAMRSLNSTSENGVLVPLHNHYSISSTCGETGLTSRKHKEEDMAKKRREMQDKLKRDAEDYMKKKKEKEQKKREEYILRHKFMYPDLFGGQKLGSDNTGNVSENLQPEIDNVPVVTLRIQQEEARRKMQEEYDAKARKHAEEMKKAEETKRAQQAEAAAKLKVEAGKYKVGRRNTDTDVNVYTEPVTLRIQEEEARRKMQEEYDAKARKHAEEIKKAEETKRAQQAEAAAKLKVEAGKYKVGRRNTDTDVNVYTEPDPVILRTEQEETRKKMQESYDVKDRKHAGKMIQVKKPNEQEIGQNDLECQEKMEAHHYKYGRLPAVPTLKLRLDSVKKYFDEDQRTNSALVVSKNDEMRQSEHVSSINEKKPADKEKEYREEMMRVRLKMQEAMNLKLQEFQAESNKLAD